MNYYKQLEEQIESEIDQKGYRNKSITYKEFQELYRDYEKEITELQFANLLGITEGNYKTLKNRGTRAPTEYSNS